MKFLSKRDSKDVLIENGLSTSLLEDYALVSTKHGISVISREISRIILEDFNIVSIGLDISRLKQQNI